MNGTNTSKMESNHSMTDNKVLQQMCDNIHQNQALLNGHIRKMFSLESVLMKDGQFLKKATMMNSLSEYDNLIKAIGAL